MSFSGDNTYLYLLTSTAELSGTEHISEDLGKHADRCLALQYAIIYKKMKARSFLLA